MSASRSLRISSVSHLGAHDDGAAALVVGGERAGAAEDQAAGREIRARHDLAQLVDGDLGIVEVRDAGVDHLAQVVRRHVGGHADGDAARAVHEQIGEFGRQNHRLLQRAVVVLAEVDRLLVEIVEQAAGHLGQAAFGVALRRRRIAIDGAEVALPIDQRQAHGEVLRHAHERIVDRRVAVRMVLTHHLADDAGRLHILLVPVEPEFVHAEQDAAMHRLQAVAHVGQRARHDHAHGVIEIAALHLIGDGDGPDVARALVGRRAAARSLVVVGQVGSTVGLLTS